MAAMELGRHHPLLKLVRSLRRADARRESGLFVAEGLHLAAEALACGIKPDTILFDPRLDTAAPGAELLTRLRATGAPCHVVASSVMEGLQEAQSPQPLLLLLRCADLADRPWRTRERPLIVVCDGIQDPGNLGTILRTADAAGAAGVIVSGASADPHHPKTVRASMGSIFRLPLARRAIDVAIGELREQGLRLIGTDVRNGQDYRDASLDGPCALFFGAEGPGLAPEVAAQLDTHVTIPLQAGVESLAVTAAAAVLLFEATRQPRGG